MPIFFQHQVNETTRLGIWKIEETEEYFKGTVPQHRDVTHPRKRLQHLAGRFLLQFLFPGFPYELIRIADTRKPFLPDEQYHFSISHCGDFAAAIVSKDSRVGIDIEIAAEKIWLIRDKFLSEDEKRMLKAKSSMLNAGGSLKNFQIKSDDSEPITHNPQLITLFWSAKEAVFKWFGDGGVDFRQDIRLRTLEPGREMIPCFFAKTGTELNIRYHQFDHLVLAWVIS
jgi:phosphopantetheinyl transferase